MSGATLDEALLERTYVRLERRVFNVVYRWLWHDDDAADVVQEAFVKLWDMRARVRVETIDALVFRIAVNLAANRRRRAKLWGLVGLGDDDVAATGGDPEAHSEDRRVRAAVDALPERLRKVVVLCELSGMSYAEVGAILGVPEGTVGSRRNHAFKLLREQLA